MRRQTYQFTVVDSIELSSITIHSTIKVLDFYYTFDSLLCYESIHISFFANIISELNSTLNYIDRC